MSSVSKISSLSISSSFSSMLNEPAPPSVTIQTILDVKLPDINVRKVFCGEQDCRLNELRRFTGAIIDLYVVQDTQHLFERVNWTVSHRQQEVRDFVIRRLKYWMQHTQLICDMAYADDLFLQEKREKQIYNARPTLPPPLTTVKTGRRNRTQSLTQSDTKNFKLFSVKQPSTPSASSSKRDVPFTGLLGRTLRNLGSRDSTGPKSLFTDLVKDSHSSKEIPSNEKDQKKIETPSIDANLLMETARWEGALSDTSDYELNENRVCFADIVSLSKLAEMLRKNVSKPPYDIHHIDNVIQQSTMNVTSREKTQQLDGKKYSFHRVILDGHIQFPVGISEDASEARRLAYRHMVDVCLNKGGVKMKMLTDNRVKVVKGQHSKQENRPNIDSFDMNATYISMNDLSCLSNCKMV